MQKKAIRLSQLEHFVLDEADRMMDMGFLPDLERIMNELPDERQSLFSATIDQKVAKLARGYSTIHSEWTLLRNTLL